MTSNPPHTLPMDRPRGAKPAIAIAVLAVAGLAAWYFWPASSATPGPERERCRSRQGQGRPGQGWALRRRPEPHAAGRRGHGAHRATSTSCRRAWARSTALRTVTVKPRVDGLLKSVDFTEGPGREGGATSSRRSTRSLPGRARAGGRASSRATPRSSTTRASTTSATRSSSSRIPSPRSRWMRRRRR
jgi:hypothetical protein